MGLFDFFKRKDRDESEREQLQAPEETIEQDEEESTLALAMPMFCGERFDTKKVVADLKDYWQLDVSGAMDESPAVLYVDDVMIAIMEIDAPIPSEELEPIFNHSYLWPGVREEVPTHTAHAIVTVMGAGSKLEAYKLLTMVNASILRTTETAIGVYQGGATLLLPKGLYCDFADFLQNDQLPVMLWIFMGIIHHEDGRSIYTYGLKEFGRMEMEVVNSPMQANELHEFMMMTLAYLLGYDVYLHDGETIGFSEDHKIQIRESEAVYLDGNSLKLIM